MRACEEALLLDSELQPAIALWIAANFRREAQLGAAADPTRPENYPPAAYFAQTAGPVYAAMALNRALVDGDASVALGAIEALRATGGPASVLADSDGRLPLADALSFGDRLVRVRAALALAAAAPTERFRNHQNLMPVLAEALLLHSGARNALVVDPDADSANQFATVLRGEGYNVITDVGLFTGLEKTRTDSPGVDLIVVASDIAAPTLADGLGQIRGDFRIASLPVIVIAKPGTLETVQQLTRDDERIGSVAPAATSAQVRSEIDRLARATGATALTPDAGLAISLETAGLLRDIAAANHPLWRLESIEPTLLATLGTGEIDLKLAVADLLGYVCDPAAQNALADAALDPAAPAEVRIPLFAAVANAAKRCGNLLEGGRVQRLLDVAQKEADLAIRTAASHAVGALSLPGNPASIVIRNQYGG